jgi:hypothetical protein
MVQRAVTMLLGAIYEADFHDFSYGFRQGRSPHQALSELRAQCRGKHLHWIIDAALGGSSTVLTTTCYETYSGSGSRTGVYYD